METRICHICGNEVEKHSCCQTCEAAVPAWKSPDLMTPEERVAELIMWDGIVEINFSTMLKRLSALVGRDLFTHELLDQNALIDEIMGNKPAPTIEMIYEKLVQRMGPDRVLVVDIDGALKKHAEKN